MAKPSSGQVREFWNQVEAGRVNSANLQRFLDNPEWRETSEAKTYRVTVDHSLDFAGMIGAGKYDWSSPDLKGSRKPDAPADHFRLSGEGQVETDIELVHLDRYMITEHIEVELEKRGLRSATVEELLALGAKHPELQREFPVAALGSRCVLREKESGAVLCGDGNERALNLNYVRHGWTDCYRFAAVRK